MGDDRNLNEISNLSRSDEVTKRLLDLIEQFNYQLVQENGQRRLTSVNINPRIKGTEVFLGRLPRDCYEDELVPLLMRIGRVIELRLMMDFSGSTRGYAFASFENSRIARKACDELNGYEIRPGHKIGVVKSIDNCRLFLGGVPKDKTKVDFMKELGKMLDGIINIYVYPSTEDKALNRGFVFVEFKDHRSAAMARRKLIPGRVMLWDHEVAVDWADPEPGQDIDDEIMETVSALFVRNLALGATESEIRQMMQRLTGIQVMKIKKINHFAFLHYETRAQAQRVLDIMKHFRANETSEWEFTWAKPIRKSEKLQERLRCVKNSNDNNINVNKNQGKIIKEEKNRGYNNNDNNNSNVTQNRKDQTYYITKNSNSNFNHNHNQNEEKKNLDKLYRLNRNNSTGTPDSFSSSSSTITAATTVNIQNNNNNNNDNNKGNEIIIPHVDLRMQMQNYDYMIATPMNCGITIDYNRDNSKNLPPTVATELYFNNNYNKYPQLNDPRNISTQSSSSSASTVTYSVDDLQLAEYARALGELAAKRYNANLRYEYWSNAIGTEFYCKIILEQNGCELMSYQGDPASAIHEAIRLTVPNAYAKMYSMLKLAIK